MLLWVILALVFLLMFQVQARVQEGLLGIPMSSDPPEATDPDPKPPGDDTCEAFEKK